MSQLVAAYEQLLLDNVSTVNTVESTIRNVTWFLPGRFADADIASEGLYALLSLVSSVHDRLLEQRIPSSLSLPPHPFSPPAEGGPATIPPAAPGGAPSIRVAPLLPPASEHARYTRYWSQRSPMYRRSARALQTITYIELLCEMIAHRRTNDRVRWKVVLSIETVKTFLRLLIIAITRRPVLHPATPQREFDLSLIPNDKLKRKKSKMDLKKDGSMDTRKPVLPSLGTRPPLRTHLYPLVSALPEEYQASPTTLVPALESNGELASEIISSSAVLIQILLLMRASRAPNAARYRAASLPTLSRSLMPFLVPLMLQLIARRLRAASGDSTLLAEHYSQLDRRTASHFFLQGPMWIGWTRPKIVGVVNLLNKVPLISLAGDLISGYLPLVDEYFYMVP